MFGYGIDNSVKERRRKASNYTKRNWFRKMILDRFNNKCVLCGTTDNLQLDHIVPVWEGGENKESNMQVLCRRCNIIKG